LLLVQVVLVLWETQALITQIMEPTDQTAISLLLLPTKVVVVVASKDLTVPVPVTL
jgi:hypothetical protein